MLISMPIFRESQDAKSCPVFVCTVGNWYVATIPTRRVLARIKTNKMILTAVPL
jgi:hypothetical protein